MAQSELLLHVRVFECKKLSRQIDPKRFFNSIVKAIEFFTFPSVVLEFIELWRKPQRKISLVANPVFNCLY